MVSDESPVEVLGLSTRAMSVLREHKLLSVGSVRLASDGLLLSSPSCGRKTVMEIRDAIRAQDAVPEITRAKIASLERRIAELEGENNGLRFALECIGQKPMVKRS